MITLRFVAGNGPDSRAIILRSQVCMPFTPSHVECVTPEGKYAGQHANGGMQAREPGYDNNHIAVLPDGRRCELFVPIDATDEQSAAFYAYINSSIGQPYDWKAIVDYALPVNFHDFNHAICSAKMTLGLRTKGCECPFKWPLTVPAHLISPRDLLLMLSGIVEIPH